MKYKSYTSFDFVNDPYFQKWVLDSDEETDVFWRNWLLEHPFKRPDVDEAIETILALGFDNDIAANQAFVEVWNNIKEEQLTVQDSAVLQHNNMSYSWLVQPGKLAAAVVAILLVSCTFFFLVKPEKATKQTYATKYGQTARVVLPDSSIVTLNANSTIVYAKEWSADEPREVWLKGEAFFDVLKKRKKGNAKFKVHTNELTVEVLGTTFDVNSRRGATTVVLNTGKVSLKLNKDDRDKIIVMKPGDLVTYLRPERNVMRKEVDAEFYCAWKYNKLLFNKTQLKDIATTLQDNYGLRIAFADKEIENKRFTGMVPAGDVNLLLETLQKLYGLEIIKDKGVITLAPANLETSVAN